MDPKTLSEIHQNVMRDAQAERSFTPNYGIQELMAKPAFSGFVEVGFLKGVSVSMFICRNDDGVALRCLWNGVFEPMSLALWSVLASRAACVLDVGAHSGIYSLVANAVNPQASVVSIEPLPLNFARLSLNLRANDFNTDFTVNTAVSDTDGIVPFNVASAAWYLSSGGSIGEETLDSSIPVNCTTLDNIVTSGALGPTLMKIDVEGHELKALQGASTFLDAHGPDIILESVFNQDTDALQELLTSRGYGFYVIQDDLLALEPVDHLRPTAPDSESKASFNRLATRRSAEQISESASLAKSLLA
jgi:FkbM family methyltransferase